MVKFEIPYFPPTTNHAFFVRHGRLHLSDKGRAFKTAVASHLVQCYPTELRYFKKNIPYFIYLRIYMEHLENEGWPKKTETRYKIFDATNRVKLVEDALKTAFGIDDSQNIALLSHKVQGFPERLTVAAWNLEEEPVPLNAFTHV